EPRHADAEDRLRVQQPGGGQDRRHAARRRGAGRRPVPVRPRRRRRHAARAVAPVFAWGRVSCGPVRTAVLTISTTVSRREADDESGPLLAHRAEEAGAEVIAMEVVPDDLALIEDRIRHYVDSGISLVFTTGGTGFTPDDVTPEATLAVIEREAPGLAEAMRAESLKHTPMAM